jgi:hypothetical protein
LVLPVSARVSAYGFNVVVGSAKNPTPAPTPAK